MTEILSFHIVNKNDYNSRIICVFPSSQSHLFGLINFQNPTGDDAIMGCIEPKIIL